MIVDFFRHGSGLSKGCMDYLLGEDRERENALVLTGDVELTGQLIDSSPFAKKYTSGCLSFYEHDLSDQDKQQIMQNFEQCLFPGLHNPRAKQSDRRSFRTWFRGLTAHNCSGFVKYFQGN